jgi:hypothetical protein
MNDGQSMVISYGNFHVQIRFQTPTWSSGWQFQVPIKIGSQKADFAGAHSVE